MTHRWQRVTALAACLGVAGVSNVVTFRFRTRGATTSWNLVATGALLGIARCSGHTWAELGLGAARARHGLAVGAGVSTGVGAVLAALATAGPTRQMFEDERTATTSTGELLRIVGIHIPLGTVLFEEVTFRAVLPALLAGPAPTPRQQRGAHLLCSLAFGGWHYLSAHSLKQANPAVAAMGGRRWVPDPVLLVMAGTGVAGAGFALVRWYGGHVVAPALVHLTINTAAGGIPWLRGRSDISIVAAPLLPLAFRHAIDI